MPDISNEIVDDINKKIAKLQVKAVDETIQFIKDRHEFGVSFSYDDPLIPVAPLINFCTGTFFDSESEAVESASEGNLILNITLDDLLNKMIEEVKEEASWPLSNTAPLVIESLEKEFRS